MTYRGLLTLIAVCLFTSPLVACQWSLSHASLNCDQIKDHTILSANLDHLRPDKTAAWIKQHYPIQESDIRETDYNHSEITKGISWAGREKVYSIVFRKVSLRNIKIVWESTQPTTQDILKCLGVPDAYSAFYTPTIKVHIKVFELELWYPKQGIVVRSVQMTSSDKPPEVRQHSEMTEMVVVKPGSLEQVVSAAYTPRAGAIVSETLQSLKPWPEKLQDIVVMTDTFR
jgi:hypothetical protein